jgi:excisionase family DNA binding protein
VTDRTLLVGEFLGQRIALTAAEFHTASATARRVLGDPAQQQVEAAKAPPAPARVSSNSERLFSPEEAAEMTGTSRAWWLKQARLGKLPSTKIGRRVRFSLAHIRHALGNPDYLDPSITNAEVVRKPLENKGRATTRNKKVTPIVRAECRQDAGSEGAA